MKYQSHKWRKYLGVLGGYREIKNGHMKFGFKYLLVIILVLASMSRCKKLIEVEDITSLSGANFWKTSSDVENYLLGIYGIFREAITKKDLSTSGGGPDFPYLAFTGDLRGAPVESFSLDDEPVELYVGNISNNNLLIFLQNQDASVVLKGMDIQRLTSWEVFYRAISAANILIEQIDVVTDPGFSTELRNRYKAEAVFLRSLSYFFLVRQYGDVPYNTKAFFVDRIARADMNDVLEMCARDMESVKQDLPWTYADPSNIATRAMRGSALILLMHMNAWLAAFGKDATLFNSNVVKYAKELETNQGEYTLMPIESSNKIFAGNSKESLFEVPQNSNVNEAFSRSSFFYFVYYDRLAEFREDLPLVRFNKSFIKFLYPEEDQDDRKEYWFDPITIYHSVAAEPIRFKKLFVNPNPSKSFLEESHSTGGTVIFRYSDAILLCAEALNALGNTAEAMEQVNRIRIRAHAKIFERSDEYRLKYLIFHERCRELMGEGHYWYDAVRMKMITDVNITFGYKTTETNFENRCWTWPINPAMADNNPLITLNTYWL